MRFFMKPEILDTTIRDGSYAIDFQFTPQDTAFLCNVMEKAGVKYIEIGHGLGLGANRAYKDSNFKDEDYLESSRSSVKNSLIGMFFIPGIGTEDDIKMASKLGIDFIRIGTNVTEIEKAKPYIELAKSLKLIVYSNLMKSYIVSPSEFKDKVFLAMNYGVDAVYLVDSAGCMLPEDVGRYIKTVLADDSKIKLGFHGHNNLGLANINTITSFESGAIFLDSSLAGIGRSAGNASTEEIVAILERKGVKTGIDLKHIIAIAETYIQPLLKHVKNESSVDIALGYSGIHSGNLDKIKKAAEEINRKPYEIILELKGCNEASLTDKTLDAAKKKLGLNKERLSGNNIIMEYTKEVPSENYLSCSPKTIEKLIDYMNSLSVKMNAKKAIRIMINKSLGEDFVLSSYAFHNDLMICGDITLGSIESLDPVLNSIGKKIDIFLINTDGLSENEVKKICDMIYSAGSGSIFLPYSEKALKAEFFGLFLGSLKISGDIESVLVYSPTSEIIAGVLSERLHSFKNIYLTGKSFDELWKIRNEISGDAEGPQKNIFVIMDKPQNLNLQLSLLVIMGEKPFTDEALAIRLLSEGGYIIDYNNNVKLTKDSEIKLKERNIKLIKVDTSLILTGKISQLELIMKKSEN